jgi:hypothetical protein
MARQLQLRIIATMKTIIATLVMAIIAVGCVATQDASRPPQSVVQKAEHVFGNEKAVLIWVPSSKTAADAGSPSKLARSLVRTVSRAQGGQVSIAVAGANSSKTRQVITEALSQHGGPLPGLRLLFIGDASDRDAVRAAVESRSGRFFFEQNE